MSFSSLILYEACPFTHHHFYRRIRYCSKKDSSSGCSYTVKLKYPELAIENNISGVVIVEMDGDENCMLSNPRVIKGIGYGCDEEALRMAKQYIVGRNKCNITQNNRDCKKGTTTQSIMFSNRDD